MSLKFTSGWNGTRIRINVLRINDLRSTLTSIRFIELYINNIESASETQGLPSSEIEIILLIIGRRAGVCVRNTLRPSVLGLTECHSLVKPFLTRDVVEFRDAHPAASRFHLLFSECPSRPSSAPVSRDRQIFAVPFPLASSQSPPSIRLPGGWAAMRTASASSNSRQRRPTPSSGNT